MFSVVRSTSVMIVVTVPRTIVTVARTILLSWTGGFWLFPRCVRVCWTGWVLLCRAFHDPSECGACCVSRGDAEVMPFESGAGGSDIDKNIIAFRPTGLDQPVNCVLGTDYLGTPYEEDGPPRTVRSADQ